MDETGLTPKRRFTRWRVIFLFLLLIGAFAAYARYVSNLRIGGVQVYDNLAVFDARLQNIENSVIAHEKRLTTVEKTLADAHAPSAAAQILPMQAQAATPPDDTRIAALEKQIASLKFAAPMQDDQHVYKSIRLLSSLHRLTDKIIAGKPFSTELTAFEAVAAPDESAGTPLSVLAPYADSGIPTLSTLLASFDQAVDGVNTAESVPPTGMGFWERLKYNLAHIVTIRRIDEAQAGTSPDAIVGRAQAHLEREEIEAAISDIQSLPENLRGNFSGWLEDAQRVTEIPALVSQLEDQIMLKSFGVQGPAQANPATSHSQGQASDMESPASAAPPIDGQPASRPAEPKPAD